MSPFTIDRARSEFYKYANIISEGAVTYNHRPIRRRQQVRALFWLYLEVRRLENHLYARDKQALHMLAFTTVKEAHQAFKSLTPRDKLEAALLKSLLNDKSLKEINDIASSLDAYEDLRHDADREGVRTRNRTVGKLGGRPPEPLSKVIQEIVKQDPSITLEELWDRLGGKVGVGIVISVTDDDVEAYKQDGNSEIVSRANVAKRLSDAKKAFAKTKKQHVL